MMRKILILLCVLSIGQSYSCKIRNHKAESNTAQLEGRFILKAVSLNNQIDSFSDSSYFVSFQDSSLSAYAGCNQIRGKCIQKKTSLSISAFITTKKYCRNRARQEINLTNALEQAKYFESTEQSLFLLGENVKVVLIKVAH